MLGTLWRWVGANAVGLGVGLALLRAVVPTFSGDEFLTGLSLGTVGLIAVTGLSVAVVLGLAQGWAVRPWADLSGLKWATRTSLGVLLGWPLALVVAVPLGIAISVAYPNQPPLAQTVIRYTIAALMGGIVGAAQGWLQARDLTPPPTDPPLAPPVYGGTGEWSIRRRWTRASALGGAVGFVVMLALLPLVDAATAQSGTLARLLAAFAVGACAGAAGSVVSGRALVEALDTKL